jgi:hypothetical protein
MKPKKENQIIISDLRETLKSIMKSEIEKLPETLESLETKDRINIVCKLMPFVFPKIETIKPTTGEPFNIEW